MCCRDTHGGSKEVIDSMISNTVFALSAQYQPPSEVPPQAWWIVPMSLAFCRPPELTVGVLLRASPQPLLQDSVKSTCRQCISTSLVLLVLSGAVGLTSHLQFPGTTQKTHATLRQMGFLAKHSQSEKTSVECLAVSSTCWATFICCSIGYDLCSSM